MTPKAMANDTLRIMNDGYYENQQGEIVDISKQLKKSISKVRLYTPDDLDELIESDKCEAAFDTKFEVHNETTFDALRRLTAEGERYIMCLNFASARNPGGGFLGGAVAQEECLARASGLYPTLLEGKSYYDFHRALDTSLYSDHMIYSPDVPVFRYEDGRLMDTTVPVSIITSPAVNAGAVMRNEPNNIQLIESTMYERTDKLLSLCVHQNHEVLILGAWGCGVFKNDPDMIAGIFKHLLDGKFKSRFKHVAFAVKTRSEPMLAAFSSRFITDHL